VIKLDIINRVADKTGVPKMKAEQAVEALFHSMKEALTRGERIELRGFAQAWRGPEPANRRGSGDTVREDDSLQAGERVASAR
jgi:nucleoid DNA-binding protein